MSCPRVSELRKQITKRKKEREREKKVSIWRPQSFYNLILEVIARHFCHTIYARSESLNSVHTQWERNLQVLTRGGIIPVATLEFSLPFMWMKDACYLQKLQAAYFPHRHNGRF